MTSRLHILIVIVTYQSASIVRACLDSLAPALGEAASSRVVVVDNASTDRTREVVSTTAQEVDLLVLDTNLGYAAGINRGIAHAFDDRTDAVLVLNPDIRLASDSIGSMLELLSASGTGIVVPKLIDPDGNLLPTLRRKPSVRRALGEALVGGERAGRWAALGEMVVDPSAYDEPTVASWATGAAMLISRPCLDAVGQWDESFFLYGEETDYCLRAGDAGYDVRLQPTATAVHLGGESNTSPALWSILTRNRVTLFERRHGMAHSALFRLAVMLNEALRAILGRPTSRAALVALFGRQALDDRLGNSSVDGYVCFSAQDWWYFNEGHSDFQLMRRVAGRRQVLLVNSLGMRLPTSGNTSTPWRRIGRKIRSASRGLRRPIEDNRGFHVFTPLFLPVYGDGLLSRLSRWCVLMQVRLALRWIGVRNPAVIVTLPTAWPVARQLRRGSLIAYRSDRYSALPEADGAFVAELERELLAAADVAFFASVALMESEASMTRQPVLLSHGVDTDRFRLHSELDPSQRLDGIAGPRIGYVGMIDSYTTDVGLLARVADDHPSAQLVLAGPADVDISQLTARPNVHHVGVLPFDEVPSLLAGLDVLVMPWQQNDWIRHCNPIKLKEYLAVGRPIVSTDFPEVRRFSHVIEIAHSHDDFSVLVGRALSSHAQSSDIERRGAVEGETWDDQAARLMALTEGRDVGRVAMSEGD